MAIHVLRLGHRKARDKRVTTHVALVARALGAASITIVEPDLGVVESVQGVVDRFGGPFDVRTATSWKRALSASSGTIVHLTMYGEPVQEAVARVPRDQDVVVVVGAEKVPGELFERADLNVAVGNQPHSEVAALALFLREFTGTAVYETDFAGPMRIVPSPKGKRVHGPEGGWPRGRSHKR